VTEITKSSFSRSHVGEFSLSFNPGKIQVTCNGNKITLFDKTGGEQKKAEKETSVG